MKSIETMLGEIDADVPDTLNCSVNHPILLAKLVRNQERLVKALRRIYSAPIREHVCILNPELAEALEDAKKIIAGESEGENDS